MLYWIAYRIEEIINRLKNAQKTEAEKSSATTARGAATSDSIEFDEDIIAKANLVVPATKLRRYRNLITRAVNPIHSVREWRDDQCVSEASYQLYRMSNVSVAETGKSVFCFLKGSCTEQALAVIMNLAYNLKAPGDENYIFPEDLGVSPYVNLLDVPISQVSDEKLFRSSVEEAIYESSEDVDLLSRAYCFIACSMLKMFIKPPDNYISSYEKIRATFMSLYQNRFPLSNEKPHPDAVAQIRSLMNTRDLARMTLYKLLYNANSDRDAYRSIKRFLYDIHIQNNGMHVMNLLWQASDAMSVEVSEILDTIVCRRFRKAFDAISELCNNFIVSDDVNKSRKMWTYARIFDPSFFAELQTKRCKEVVCILAFLLKEINHKNSEGVLKISHLQDMNPVDQYQSKRIAERAVAVMRKKHRPG